MADAYGSGNEDYIRRETLISMIINTLLSIGFFLLIFGVRGPVPVWGAGNLVFDFAPQGFMIGLMSTLVPGALTRKRLRQGTIMAGGSMGVLPKNLLLRSFSVAAVSAAIGVLVGATTMTCLDLIEVEPVPALLFKALFGALLAALVTPTGLRAALAVRGNSLAPDRGA